MKTAYTGDVTSSIWPHLNNSSENNDNVLFQVLTAVKVLIMVFWVVMPCGLAVTSVSEECITSIFTLKMEVIHSINLLFILCVPTLHHPLTNFMQLCVVFKPTTCKSKIRLHSVKPSQLMQTCN
jgi:hypothetical protein